jgi:hypothetical protein
MYNTLKRYSDQNKEKFNEDFILSRNDQDILDYVKDIFKALEIIEEIQILDVTLETDESTFIPIKNKHQYFKSILPSRLNKIHYKVRLTPSEEVKNKMILADETSVILEDENGEINETKVYQENENSFIIEKDLFINKLVDDYFYINEGIRYFLIYQIVDNSTYGTQDAVSLKSLLMPITVMKKETITLDSVFDSTESYPNIPVYDVLLFSKRVNPLLYVMSKYAYNSIVNMKVENNDYLITERENYKDPTLVDKFNKFFGTNIKISDDENSLVRKGKTVFKLKDPKTNYGTFISVDTDKLKAKDKDLMAILGCLVDIKSGEDKNKKKKIYFTYDDFITPNFWIDKLSIFFTKNPDPTKKFEKIKTMLISLDRLIDEATRKILNLETADKKNTLSILLYILRNFDQLSKEDNQNLNNKRIRLFEYMLYPLRKIFSDHIYRILNSPTRSKNVLDRVFSNINPMFIIKQTVVNELLRYYNSTNEMNLYSCLLKYTFRGPQSINKTVSIYQRDLHPSYTGRLSLVASSASDPGISGTLVPFVELDNYFFKKQDTIKVVNKKPEKVIVNESDLEKKVKDESLQRRLSRFKKKPE